MASVDMKTRDRMRRMLKTMLNSENFTQVEMIGAIIDELPISSITVELHLEALKKAGRIEENGDKILIYHVETE